MLIYQRILIAIGILLSLNGCGTVPGVMDADTNNLGSDKVLLILSTTAETTCKVSAAQLVLKAVDSPPVLLKSIGVLELNNGFQHSDFENVHGKLYSLLLSPGKYDIWLRSENPYSTYAKGGSNPIVVKPIDLTGGTVTYIGEFSQHGGCGLVSLDIRNSFARDIARLKAIKPDLHPDTIQVHLAELNK